MVRSARIHNVQGFWKSHHASCIRLRAWWAVGQRNNILQSRFWLSTSVNAAAKPWHVVCWWRANEGGRVSVAECVALIQASRRCRSPFSVKSVDLLSWSWSCQLQMQPVSAVFQPWGVSKPIYVAQQVRAGWTMSCYWASTARRWTI